MSNDDEALAEYDLSAWDAPPPPAGLADAVIDRMGGTDVGIAVPVEDEHRATPRRAWIIAGAAVAALLLALGVWSLIRSTHKAAPSSGGVLADKARTLDLDTVHADLDPGADVRWRRDGGVWLVEQRAGRAAWRVDGDEKLVVIAGAGLASVEATGANLRVEVQMNAMDARVIGASALTAAAVAMVTVVVYEGHVNVGRGVGQQTVVVAPGASYTVRNEDNQNLVGSAPITTGGGKKVAILGLQLDGKYRSDAPVVAQVMGATLRAAAQSDGRFQLPLNADKELVDEKLLMNCATEATPCMAAIGADLGVDLLVFGHIEQLSTGYRISAKLLDVGKKEIASSGEWALGITEAEGKGLDKWGSHIYADLVDGNQTVCDAEALKEEGMQHITVGQHAEALAKFEASLACKQDSYVTQLAFMESCSSSNSPKAKQYYKMLTPAQQQKFGQMCIRMKVAYQDDFDFSGECDEVSCVLNNYDGECCQKFKKAAVPDRLDKAAIEKGIATVKDRVLACGEPANAGVKQTMRVTVNPKGSVDTVLFEDVTVPAGASKPTPEVAQCTGDAVAGAKFIATKNGGSFSYPFVFASPKTVAAPPANCDADALKDQAMELINQGQHAAALAKLELSLKCKNDPYVAQLAFTEACSSSNSPKAKFYYQKLTPAQQQKFGLFCDRMKVDYLPTGTPAAAKNCDADALKEQGMNDINMGQHAAALSKFEASLACRGGDASVANANVIQLAFMESCNSANVAKAKKYFKLMSPAARDKFEQICIRNKIAVRDFDDDPTAGFLDVATKPVGAKVLIDGNDTGLTTPVSGQTLSLKAGKHKVTLIVDGDRFTYSVTIQAGQTAKMFKDLE